jgi:septum formation protein
MNVVLASKSPRRADLLRRLGYADFLVCPAVGEESDGGLPETEAVGAIALGKAREVARRRPMDDLIIAADTLVYLGGRALGKPENAAGAFEMLRCLAGRSHVVRTGVALLRNGREMSAVEETTVHFREMTDGEIWAYIATGEPMDKAGAYGIQGKGAVFIDWIRGDFFNVVGLPLCRLGCMLKDFGEILP